VLSIKHCIGPVISLLMCWYVMFLTTQASKITAARSMEVTGMTPLPPREIKANQIELFNQGINV
jgi:hypothetical protein